MIGDIGEHFKNSDDHVICILLAAGAVLLYINTLPAGFVSDDRELIEENERVRSLGQIPAYFVEPFSQKGLAGGSSAYYRPVVSATFTMDYALYGRQPWGYHLTNILLYALCVVLVYLLFRRFLPGRWGAAGGAVIFLAHPLHTETVSWISGRTDLLALVFMLVAVHSFLHARRRGRSLMWFPILAGCAGLAMLSKEVALVLLPLWGMYELTWGRTDREASPRARRVAVGGTLGLATIGYILARWLIVGGVEAASGQPIFDAWTLSGLATVARCVLEYARKLLFPLHLSFAFEIDPFTGMSTAAWLMIGGGFIMLCISIGAVVWRPAYGFWTWWIWLGLVPALNLVPINEMVAERFLFVPSVGYAALIGMLIGMLPGRKTSFNGWRAAGAVFILMVGAMGAQTVIRNEEWRTERSLYLSALRASPQRPMAHILAAEVYLSDPDSPERSVHHYRRALQLSDSRPGFRHVAHNGLGRGLQELDRPFEALSHLREAVELNPDNPVSGTNYGLLLMDLGEEHGSEKMVQDGAEKLKEVISREPGHADALFGLGYWAMKHEDDQKEAVELLGRAARADADFDAPLIYQAEAFVRMGRRGRAIDALENAIERTPDNARAYHRKAELHLAEGETRRALRDAETAFTISGSPESKQLLEKIRSMADHREQ
ncbi:MAG: tetratricopeptide repeat protein [Planctomycetota bacterium]